MDVISSFYTAPKYVENTLHHRIKTVCSFSQLLMYRSIIMKQDVVIINAITPPVGHVLDMLSLFPPPLFHLQSIELVGKISPSPHSSVSFLSPGYRAY